MLKSWLPNRAWISVCQTSINANTPDSGIWNTFDFPTVYKQLLHAGNKIMGCVSTYSQLKVWVYLCICLCECIFLSPRSHLTSAQWIVNWLSKVCSCVHAFDRMTAHARLCWMCVDPLWVGGKGANTVIKFAHTYSHTVTRCFFLSFSATVQSTAEIYQFYTLSFTFLSFACDQSSSIVSGKLDK